MQRQEMQQRVGERQAVLTKPCLSCSSFHHTYSTQTDRLPNKYDSVCCCVSMSSIEYHDLQSTSIRKQQNRQFGRHSVTDHIVDCCCFPRKCCNCRSCVTDSRGEGVFWNNFKEQTRNKQITQFILDQWKESLLHWSWYWDTVKNMSTPQVIKH